MAVTSSVNPTWIISTDTLDGKHTSKESAFVLNDVLKLFSRRVPINKERSLRIGEWDRDHPMYIISGPDAYQQIFLHTAGSTYWAQNVYQVAHELTHFAIFHGIEDSRFQWFEESLAELSSYFFLEKMSRYWAGSSIASKRSYSQSFRDYAQSEHKRAEYFNLSDLSKPSSVLSTALWEERYDRPKNNYVAQRILPITKRESAYWTALPFLEDVHGATDFIDFLAKWKTVSPRSSWKAISQITSLFESRR